MPSANAFKLSVLDLSPIAAGSSSSEALRNTLDLAQLADRLGYTRYWLAEHHNIALIASTAPEIMIGHVASVTSRIRVGSGGIMLPNHSPLKVAETFKMLEALHPGRIDLGLGRAPGTDQLTALALRRSRELVVADEFPQQLGDLASFLSGDFPADHPFRRIKAYPTVARLPELWLLGSSDFSAQLAAEVGLGFAFAHHINPSLAVAALQFYRQSFRPSPRLATPQALLATHVICAETDELAEELASSADLNLLRYLSRGQSQPLASVAEAKAYSYTAEDRVMIRHNRSRLTVGSPATVRASLTSLADAAGIDEIMITTMIHDHAARRRSYELLAAAFLE